MKNLKSIITVIAICLVTSLSANNSENNPTKSNEKLRSEIVSILGSKVPLVLTKSSEAEVSFIVNDKNEIVVISVDSASSEFNSFVKNKLNYKKINETGAKKGEIYKMPVKINKK